MKTLQFHYHMDVVFSEPVYNHTYTLKCLPQTTQTQEITECAVEVFPKGKMQESADSFGNRMLYGEAQEKQSCFSVDVTGMAKTGLYKQAAESDSERALYKYQTSLTSPGMQIQSLLGRLRKNSACSQKERIYSYMNAVYESMQYTKGVTSISTTAEEALSLGQGVCQDYAHILLSLCREEKIPARYVVGLLLGEGESHAWIEAFDGERWRGFDPTNNRLAEEDHIKISHGRDYRDCSINRGVFTGRATQRQTVLVRVTEV